MIPPLETLASSPIIFRVPLVSDAAKRGGWTVLGNVPLIGLLGVPAAYRNQPVGSNQLYIIVGNARNRATYDEVKDLEAMSWWFEHQVVRRLNDHFNGTKNQDAEILRRIKIYDPQSGQEIGTH